MGGVLTWANNAHAATSPSAAIFGQVAWLSFGIASSDRIVSKTGVPVTLCFTLATLLPIGGTITLSYPAGFFAVSTPTEQPGSSSVAGFTGTCAATTSTSVVVNSAGATVPASSFVITLPGFVMGGVTAGTVGVTLATSADTAASVAVSSGSIATQVTIVSLSINANDRITLKPSVPITLSFPPTTLLLPGATITILFQTAFSPSITPSSILAGASIVPKFAGSCGATCAEWLPFHAMQR